MTTGGATPEVTTPVVVVTTPASCQSARVEAAAAFGYEPSPLRLRHSAVSLRCVPRHAPTHSRCVRRVLPGVCLELRRRLASLQRSDLVNVLYYAIISSKGARAVSWHEPGFRHA